MITFPILSKNKYKWALRFVGTKVRYDTLTDIVFINDELIVCADRQDRMLYLVKINNEMRSCTIIHKLSVPHHPDLMDSVGNLIYIVNLDNNVTICEVVSNSKIVLKGVEILNFSWQYHGLCINPFNKNELYLTGTRAHKFLSIFDISNRKISGKYTIPKLENCYLKDITFIDKNRVLIIGSESGPSDEINAYKSYINLYRFDEGKFVFLDGLTYENSHMDSIVYTGEKYYVTAQVNDIGYLLNGFIEDDFIVPLKNITVADFPHGLALYKNNKNNINKIAFTCYSTSSVYISDADLAAL
jgi:hypothetical protein